MVHVCVCVCAAAGVQSSAGDRRLTGERLGAAGGDEGEDIRSRLFGSGGEYE